MHKNSPVIYLLDEASDCRINLSGVHIEEHIYFVSPAIIPPVWVQTDASIAPVRSGVGEVLAEVLHNSTVLHWEVLIRCRV